MTDLQVVLPMCLGTSDISLLGPLVSASEQHHDLLSLEPEIDAIPRSKIQTRLARAVANRSVVPRLPVAKRRTRA